MTAAAAEGHDRPGPLSRRLLRSLLGGGIAYFVLFVAVHAALIAERRFVDGVDLLLLALVAAPQLVLVLRRRLEVSGLGAAGTAGALVLAAVIGMWHLPLGAGGSSYSAWFLGAIAFTLLGLTLVGRFGTAWLTMAAIVLVAVGWSAVTGQGAAFGVGLVVRHVGTLLVGTALAFGLRRSSAAYLASRTAERARLAEEQAARASAVARRAAAERVLEQAGPMLQAIADGRALTQDERRRLLVLEGTLRDDIRTPMLVRGTLRTSVDAARRRGINVLLMDEAPTADEEARTPAAAWLAARLDAVTSGAFVGRLRDADGVLRASAVADDRTETRTF